MSCDTLVMSCGALMFARLSACGPWSCDVEIAVNTRQPMHACQLLDLVKM